ncbi:hypothetical protein SDC9_154698 [bioreactor metagenome]|uniref:Uncharacterized protein n=1 Tax=bioreactor metagenome TaxID=1076179 RepID=A0A645EZE6_9ZZZZ
MFELIPIRRDPQAVVQRLHKPGVLLVHQRTGKVETFIRHIAKTHTGYDAFYGLCIMDQAFDKLIDPIHLSWHIPGKGFLHLFIIALGADEGGKGSDGHERIADFMGDPRGNADERQRFFLLEGGLPCGFFLGNILYGKKDAANLSIENFLVHGIAVGAQGIRALA